MQVQYQATQQFYDGAGCLVTLMASPADTVEGSILNLGALRNVATYYGLTLEPPQKKVAHGGISQHKVIAVSRQRLDDEHGTDVAILFTEYFPQSLGRIYLNTPEQRDEFRERTGLNILSLDMAASAKKEDKAVRRCSPFEIVKIQTGFDTANNPKYRFEFLPESQKDTSKESDAPLDVDMNLPSWLQGENYSKFAGFCAKQMDFTLPSAYETDDGYCAGMLNLALEKMPGKSWADFTSGKEAGQALVEALGASVAQPPDDGAPWERGESDRAEAGTPKRGSVYNNGGKPASPQSDDEGKPSAGADKPPTGVHEILEARDTTLIMLTAKEIRYKGNSWVVSTACGVDIVLKDLQSFIDAGWDHAGWDGSKTSQLLANIPAVIERDIRGWRIRELKVLTPPPADVAPTSDAMYVKLKKAVDATFRYPLGDVWTILGIEKAETMDVDALHMLVLERIKETGLAVAPNKCRYFKDSGTSILMFETPIGLSLKLFASKTWFRGKLGKEFYDRIFKGWQIGKKDSPSEYTFAKDDLFYLTWEEAKSSTPGQPLRVVDASMDIPDTPF